MKETKQDSRRALSCSQSSLARQSSALAFCSYSPTALVTRSTINPLQPRCSTRSPIANGCSHCQHRIRYCTESAILPVRPRACMCSSTGLLLRLVWFLFAQPGSGTGGCLAQCRAPQSSPAPLPPLRRQAVHRPHVLPSVLSNRAKR